MQAARATAARAQCLNNLKQIGLAIQSYLQVDGAYPPVALGRRVPGGSEVYSLNYSAFARILPHLEQPALFNSINFQVDATPGLGPTVNATAMMTSLSVLLCPSDPGSPVPGYGRANYRMSLGPTPSFGPVPGDPGTDVGPFTYARTFRPSDFPDGLSNTMGVSERLQGDWTRGAFRRGGDYLGPSQAIDGLGLSADQAVRFCSSLREPEAVADSRGGETWFLSGSTFTLYNHCTTPNSRLGDCVFEMFLDTIHSRSLREGVMGASSAHPGGVNGLAMDGGVRFVRDAVDLAVWRALGTRAGGESIATD